jgi:cyclopropane-fatty-acyl-phospholipid synthase
MELTASGRARQIVQRVFRDYPGGLAVRLWDGDTLTLGAGTPEATLVIREPRLLRELILVRDPLRVAEAYFQNRLDVEGNLYAILGLKDHLQSLRLSAFEKASFLLTAVRIRGAPPPVNAAPAGRSVLSLRPWRRHSRDGNRQAIAFHYDVSNDFYRLWLDEQMIYSCAYFETPSDSLDRAQCNKLDHICRKLRLEPGERLLDIGCGWGALIRWAAKHYGVQAHGVTLSRNQYDHARQVIRDEGLQDRVTVELRDYRELEGEARYDKIASVGMFEHVGLKNLPRYFGVAKDLLKPGGLFLNHGITHDQEGWGDTAGTRFINRYVFPDGELDTVSNVQRVMERAGFEVLDVEGLRPHYGLTLRHWVARLECRKTEAQALVSESTYRVWRLYMAACARQFEEGAIGVYQILASNRNGKPAQVPLTRRDLYVAD